MLHHIKSCQQVLPLGSAPAALALRPVCSSVPPPCMGQAPAGLSHTAGTFLHKWLLLFLGSRRCHSWEPRSAAAAPRASHRPCLAAPRPGQAQPQAGTKPRTRDWLKGAAALQLGAGHSGKPQVLLKRPLCPSMEGRQEQDDPQKSRGHCGWGQQGSCLSLGATHMEHPGATDCVPHRDAGCCIQDSPDTCPEEPAWQRNPGAAAGSEKHHATSPYLFELGWPKAHTGLRWDRFHQTQAHGQNHAQCEAC